MLSDIRKAGQNFPATPAPSAHCLCLPAEGFPVIGAHLVSFSFRDQYDLLRFISPVCERHQKFFPLFLWLEDILNSLTKNVSSNVNHIRISIQPALAPASSPFFFLPFFINAFAFIYLFYVYGPCCHPRIYLLFSTCCWAKAASGFSSITLGYRRTGSPEHLR